MHKNFQHLSSSCLLRSKPDDPTMYYLHSLVSLQLRQGHARELMKKVLAWADRNQYTLFLGVGEFGARRDVMSNDQLEAWYKRLGFIDAPPAKSGVKYLLRPPSQDLQVP